MKQSTSLLDEGFFANSDDIVYPIGFGLDYNAAMVSNSSQHVNYTGSSVNANSLSAKFN